MHGFDTGLSVTVHRGLNDLRDIFKGQAGELGITGEIFRQEECVHIERAGRRCHTEQTWGRSPGT